MRTSLLLLVSVLVVGCGAGELDQRLDGEFVGVAQMSFLGLSTVSYDGSVRVDVSKTTAAFTGVCPNGSGSVMMAGAGEVATWDGALECGTYQHGDCNAIALTYSTALVELRTDPDSKTRLYAYVDGEGVGCNTARQLKLTFVGTRRD